MSEANLPPLNDLGLTLEQAKDGLAAATTAEFGMPPPAEGTAPVIYSLDALRVQALYMLMIDKGMITEAEYDEACRLIYNSDLARREQKLEQEFR